MGKAARAAAREHDVHRIARDEARQALDVGGIADADVMVRAEEIASELDVLRQARPGIRARMQQQKLRLGADVAIEEATLERVQRQFLVGARDQQHAVGLPQAEARPGAVGFVALVEHNVVFGFEAVEPLGGFVARGRIRAPRPWRPS